MPLFPESTSLPLRGDRREQSVGRFETGYFQPIRNFPCDRQRSLFFCVRSNRVRHRLPHLRSSRHRKQWLSPFSPPGRNCGATSGVPHVRDIWSAYCFAVPHLSICMGLSWKTSFRKTIRNTHHGLIRPGFDRYIRVHLRTSDGQRCHGSNLTTFCSRLTVACALALLQFTLGPTSF